MAKKEQRRSNRFPIRQLVDISSRREQFFKATGLNISEHGIYCEVEKPVDVYTRVYIMLEIPNDDPVEVEGIVVRNEKKGKENFVAIEFADVDDYIRAGLDDFIKTVAKGK